MYMIPVATSVTCVMLAPLAATPVETNSEQNGGYDPG
jgi:hypothetical protein